MKDLKVAVVGLGYVGLPLAVEFGKNEPLSVSISIRGESLNCGKALTLLLK